jgi:hypothetical protein
VDWTVIILIAVVSLTAVVVAYLVDARARKDGTSLPPIPAVSRRPILENPIILVTESITRTADLVPLMQLAQAQDKALVLVATQFSNEVLGTIALNAVSGRLAEWSTPKDQLALAATATGATIISAADLAAGWLPETSLGRCKQWIPDNDPPWIVEQRGSLDSNGASCSSA